MKREDKPLTGERRRKQIEDLGRKLDEIVGRPSEEELGSGKPFDEKKAIADFKKRY